MSCTSMAHLKKMTLFTSFHLSFLKRKLGFFLGRLYNKDLIGVSHDRP